MHMYHTFFIQSSADGHLGCFHVLAIVNSATMNTEVHVSFLIRAFVFSGYMPRSGIAGSYGNSVFSFSMVVVVVWSLSRVQLLQLYGLWPTRLLCPQDFSGKNTGVGCLFLLQGIFSFQGSNLCLLHCRQILYLLSLRGSSEYILFIGFLTWILSVFLLLNVSSLKIGSHVFSTPRTILAPSHSDRG